MRDPCVQILRRLAGFGPSLHPDLRFDDSPRGVPGCDTCEVLQRGLFERASALEQKAGKWRENNGMVMGEGEQGDWTDTSLLSGA
jgi:hypothetical protein